MVTRYEGTHTVAMIFFNNFERPGCCLVIGKSDRVFGLSPAHSLTGRISRFEHVMWDILLFNVGPILSYGLCQHNLGKINE